MLARGLRFLVLAMLLPVFPPAQALDFACGEETVAPVYSGDTLRVLSINLAHGRGTSLNQLLVSAEGTRSNLASVATVLEKYGPAVVALQEADDVSSWSGSFNHVRWLSENTDYPCLVHGVHAQSALYRFGTGLLANVQLYEPQLHSFEPTPPTTTKGFVIARIRWRVGEEEREIGLVSVHLDFSRKSVRRAQVQAVLDAVAARETPLVIMGDFNAGWEREDSVVRALVDGGGLQVWQPDASNHTTYKDKRLDWILLTPELRFAHQEVDTTDISDHRAVVADIGWAPGEGE